jgi:hypothetical protein
MTARVLTANSTIAVRTINNGLCIATSPEARHERSDYMTNGFCHFNLHQSAERDPVFKLSHHVGRIYYDNLDNQNRN